ncbi:hypothetical protein RJ640_019108 [Escallonia rubra]|uniref:Trehalase n=1 Tax=Escallonia rubra TaxID=112253 RepID=A0AA88RB10_9ASTE|nr:hypothetical protein RJ640_019108 [Escallonia rubra]
MSSLPLFINPKNLPVVFSLLLFTVTAMSITAAQASGPCVPTDSGPVIPTTPLVKFLERLQETALNTFGPKGFDPKLYVDMSLKVNLSTTLEAFNNLPRTKNGSVSDKELNRFIEEYLNGVDEDLVYVEPVDFVAEPDGFLPKVENREVRAWALEVHSLWKNLSRKVSDRVLERPELHTLLPLPKPVIIPGSRFREVYYWDSYWIIRGLLASKMYETAKGIVTNLVALIDEFGHVLNGARAYYSNRSQPPLLSSMVVDIYKTTGDMNLIKMALPALLKEHKFWNSGIHKVTIQDSQGSTHTLSRYYAMWNEPRPESSTIDKESAFNLSNNCEKQQFYRELASVAESGWDFSTRWMRNASDFTTLAATSILPVDLNTFILKMELDISFLANAVGENNTAAHFMEAAGARQEAMNSVFWNAEMGQWLDYWLKGNTMGKDVFKWEACNQNHNVFASNFIPLWIQLFNSGCTKPSTFELAPRCWDCNIFDKDFPNGWAPIQHMIVDGLLNSGSKEAKSLAKDIAMKWIKTNYVAFTKTRRMHEKYDVDKCGDAGGGGEYVPQTGFGWSNGVVLAFLEEFGWPRDLKIGCQ